MANIRQVFDVLVDAGTKGIKIKVNNVETFKEYETYRTRLCTFWSNYREILVALGGEDNDPMCELSLCGTYDKNDRFAIFFLGKSRRKEARQFSFEIIDPGTDTGKEIGSSSTNSGSVSRRSMAKILPGTGTEAVNEDDESRSILAQIS